MVVDSGSDCDSFSDEEKVIEYYYLIKERHFTRSIEVLSDWEKDPVTYDLANAFKSVLQALMRTGDKVKLNDEKRPFSNCDCGFFVTDH